MKKNQKQCDGQLDLSVALRTECQIKEEYPCTYYVASQYRYMACGEECKSKCCYGCEEKELCGYACYASKR